MAFIAFIIIVIGFWALNSYFCKRKKIISENLRKERIYQKYGRTEIAEKVIQKTIWVGETSEQLIDSLGQPCDVDESVLKTKRKEIWKYYQKGANRYGLKIKVENDVIVGWDEKL
mgnify:CR=1 FL=1